MSKKDLFPISIYCLNLDFSYSSTFNIENRLFINLPISFEMVKNDGIDPDYELRLIEFCFEKHSAYSKENPVPNLFIHDKVILLKESSCVEMYPKLLDSEFQESKSQLIKHHQIFHDEKLSQVQHNLKKNLSLKISYNRQRLNKLKVKLDQLEDINKTGNVKLCFGSKKLFRQQFLINTSNNKTAFKTHEQWYEEFNYQRNKEITFIGSKDESAGNLNCQINYIKDNLFKLKININPKAINPIDKYLELTFKMNHELEKLKEIIVNNNSKNKELWQALTYKLIKQKNKYHKDKYVVSISFERNLIKKINTSKSNGCIGVDINQDHLAITNLDNKGNLLNIETFNYDLNGKKHQNQNSISLAVKDLMKIAVKLNKLIVIEKLDFREKKKNLSFAKYQNKKRNKQLSSFAYSKIIELIKARAEDNNIEVKEINPAYTSIISLFHNSKKP